MNNSVPWLWFIFALQVLLFNGGRVHAMPADDKDFNKDSKLVLSHVIYRHGNRSPTTPYPTDPNTDESAWPVEFGQLTNEGTRQHYHLGQFLRDRYSALLPDRYSPKSIYVRSTDLDRTMESAMANLAGMFPPTTEDKWNEQLIWNPIPVHVVPESAEYLIGGFPPKCPAFDKELNDLMNSVEFNKTLAQSTDLRNYLTQHSGYNLNSTSNHQILLKSVLLRDILFIESIHNMILPEWTKSIFPSKEYDDLVLIYYTLHSRTPTLAKVRVGFLLKEIVDHCLSKVAGTLIPNRSVYVYSTHDSVMSNLLNVFGMFDNEFPGSASCILLELRIKDDEPYLQVFYKNNPDPYKSEATPMFIPNCGYTCKLSNFINLHSDFLPTEDINTLCNNIDG